jgi:hypothetical protein
VSAGSSNGHKQRGFAFTDEVAPKVATTFCNKRGGRSGLMNLRAESEARLNRIRLVELARAVAVNPESMSGSNRSRLGISAILCPRLL